MTNIDPGANLPGLVPLGPALPETPNPSTPREYIPAALQRENAVFRALDYFTRPVHPPNPDYGIDGILDTIGRGSKYEQYYLDDFIHDRSTEETLDRMARIDEMERGNELLARGGWGAVVAAMAGGVLDPTILIPLAGWLKTTSGASRAIRTAETGLVTGGIVAGQEAILQSTDETRTDIEGIFNVAAGTLIGGVLGAATHRLPTGELDRLGKAYNDGVPANAVQEQALMDSVTPDHLPVSEQRGTAEPAAVGAAVSSSGRTTGVTANALGVDKALSATNPVSRAMAAPSVEHRRVMLDLAETAQSREDSVHGVVASEGGPVQSIIRDYEFPRVDSIGEMRRQYADYVLGNPNARNALPRAYIARKAGAPKLSFREFRREVAKAWFRGDQHEIPQVAAAARYARQKVFDPMREDAIARRVEGFSEDMEVPSGDKGYGPRDYDNDLIEADRGGFEAILIRGLERAQRAAQAARRNADEAAETASEAVEEVDDIAGASRAELEDFASRITDRVLGQNPERIAMPGELKAAGVKGSLNARALNFVTSEELLPYLRLDAAWLISRHVRSLGPDLALLKKFPNDLNLEGEIARVGDDYDRLYKQATTPKERKRLNALKVAALRDIKAVRDRLRRTYGIPDNPNGMTYRTFRVVRDLNYMRYLGMVTPSSLPDVGKVPMYHGMGRALAPAWGAMTGELSKIKLAANEVKIMGTGLDMLQDQRMMALGDIASDAGARGTWFERGIHAAAENFSFVNLMAPWNSFMKQWAGIVAQTRFLQTADALAHGRRVSKKDMAALADVNIDHTTAGRISEMLRKHGDMSGHVWWANTEAWMAEGAQYANAARIFRRAVAKNVDEVIVTRGQDFPLILSKEFGRTIGQFKSFGFASQQRTVIAGLQRRDAGVMNGVALMMALGAFRFWLGAQATGRGVEGTSTEKWIAEAFDRSGVAGWLMDANNISERLSGGKAGLSLFTGETVSRYQGRNWLASLMGPSADLAESAAAVLRATTTGEVAESDIRALRKMIPGQNLLGISRAFDRLERSSAESLGIPVRN